MSLGICLSLCLMLLWLLLFESCCHFSALTLLVSLYECVVILGVQISTLESIVGACLLLHCCMGKVTMESSLLFCKLPWSCHRILNQLENNSPLGSGCSLIVGV
jgi:hypothetical protein